MSLPIKRKLTILQGATFRRRWTWKPGGVPMDFTGCTARLQVRAEIESVDVLLELTTENGGIVLGGAAGTIDLWVGATETTTFTWDSGVWALEIQYPTGADYVDRLIEGSIVVSPEVPR